jgi:hypothetical protein
MTYLSGQSNNWRSLNHRNQWMNSKVTGSSGIEFTTNRIARASRKANSVQRRSPGVEQEEETTGSGQETA